MGLLWDCRESLVEEAQSLGSNALCVSKEMGKAKPREASLSHQPSTAKAPGLPSDSVPPKLLISKGLAYQGFKYLMNESELCLPSNSPSCALLVGLMENGPSWEPH